MSNPGVYPFAPPAAVVQTLQLSGGDAGTAETVQEMCRLIDAGSKDPEVNRLAIAIVHDSGVPEFNFEGERRAIYTWFRQNIRFLRDIEGKETLRSARETLANRMGDCDCQTIAMLALMKTIGQRVRIVTVATQPQAPDQFSHVFPEVRDERGRWIPIDAARKKPRYGLAPRGWFRRYGWDTETCQAVDLDRPEAAAEFDSDDVGKLNGLGTIHRGLTPAWGLRGLAGTRTNVRMAQRAAAGGRVRLSRLSGLGQDWSTLVSAIPGIETGTANIIAASRANPINLAPTTALPGQTPGAMTPAAQALLLQSGAGGASQYLSSPTLWILLGVGALVFVVASNRR